MYKKMFCGCYNLMFCGCYNGGFNVDCGFLVFILFNFIVGNNNFIYIDDINNQEENENEEEKGRRRMIIEMVNIMVLLLFMMLIRNMLCGFSKFYRMVEISIYIMYDDLRIVDYL